MEQRLFDLLARDGIWLLFAAQMFGIFGLPIPDELLLTFAGGLVRRGDRTGDGDSFGIHHGFRLGPLSRVPGSARHPGHGIIRRLESAATYGSYDSRSARSA